MILKVLMYKNELLGAYSNPMFLDNDLEGVGTELQRKMILNGKRDLNSIKQYEDVTLYHVANFDDETGKFEEVNATLLLDCRAVFKNVLKQFHPEMLEGEEA